MPKLTGGGIQGNKNVKVGVRAGPPSTNVISPRGVSQYGYATGSKMSGTGHYTTGNTALPVKERTAAQVPLGNALTNNVGPGGPGTGRTLYGQGGTNRQHGPAVPGQSPGRRDTVAEYGPETSSMASLVQRR